MNRNRIGFLPEMAMRLYFPSFIVGDIISGHGVLMGKIKNEWQERDYVLKWFGPKQGEAKKAYRNYVQKGINQGRRPELVGGGLIRSLGGWSAVKAMRRSGDRELSDDRILGSGEFVERIIKAADAKIKYQLPVKEQDQKIDEFIAKSCKNEKVSIKELRSGSRRREVSGVRALIAINLDRFKPKILYCYDG